METPLTDTPLTEAAIRQLDGMGLTRLAHTLGLAPTGTEGYQDLLQIPRPGVLWRPHLNKHQALDVFDGLRERGWDTFQEYVVAPAQGNIEVLKDGLSPIGILWGRDHHVKAEAHALLLCAVLATVLEQQAQTTTCGAMG